MRKLYLISYDINMVVKNYDELYAEIKQIAGVGEYQHPLESVWIINTQHNANEISARLREKMAQKDSLLVIELGTDRQGWLPKSVWAWIREKINTAE